MPRGAVVLSVDRQGENIVLYAKVDPESVHVEVHDVWVFGTGHPIPTLAETACFVGTVNLYAGQLMFHVFTSLKVKR